MFSSRHCITRRCVYYNHTMPGGFIQVDVVHTDTGATDDLKFLTRCNNLSSYFGLAAYHQRIVFRYNADKLGGLQFQLYVNISLRAEDVYALFGNAIGNQDFMPHIEALSLYLWGIL